MLLKLEGPVRYVFHKEHKHPLLLEHRTRAQLMKDRCRKCYYSPPGMTYGCSECRFYLHASCVGVDPDEVENHLLHDDHPLTRVECADSRCSCCGFNSIYPSVFYKCSACDFSLDKKCALAVPANYKQKQDPPGGHKSCQLCRSAMVLIEEEEEYDGLEICCIVCEKRCSGRVYNCPSCKFFLHKSCSDGSRVIIQHPSHPSHQLKRNMPCLFKCSACLEDQVIIQHPSHPSHQLERNMPCLFKCSACLEDQSGTSFRCEECDFELDFKCAFLVAPKGLEAVEPVLTAGGEKRDCVICYEPLPPPSTDRRSGCFVNVHESCAVAKIPGGLYDLRSPIINSRLRRSHRTIFTCDACLQVRSGCYFEYYRRGRPRFKLDMRCAYLDRPLIIFDGHNHPLVFLEDLGRQETCSTCSKPCRWSVFHCPTCGIFNLHLFCGPLPCSIKQESHLDTLVLKDSHLGDYASSELFYCDSCEGLEERRDPLECVYYCARCNYCAEIKCVMPELMLALTGKSGDVELRTLGRWSRRGKLLSKGLLSEEMQQHVRGTATTDTKHGCYLKHITQSLTEDEIQELDGILNSAGKSRDGDRLQDARPDSDEEFNFMLLVKKLDASQSKDIKKSWDSDMLFVHVGEFLVPEHLLGVYNDLYRKYGDLSAETKLTPRLKALLLIPLCEAVEGMCSTKVVEVTEDELKKWWLSVKAVWNAGFKIQFAVHALMTVVQAYYGLTFRRKLDQETSSVEERILEVIGTLERLKGELKHHKEYFDSKEPSLVKECMGEATFLMYKTAGEIVLP